MKKSTNGRSRATRYLRMQQLLIVVLALMMVFQFSTPTLGGLVWASDDEASAERQSTEDYQTEELKQVEITADTDTEETVEQTAQDQNDTSVDVTDDDETSAEKADDVQETEQNGDTDSKEASAQSGSNLSSEENDSNPDTVDTAHPTDKTDDGSDDETTQKDDESGDVTDKETDDVSEKETADDSDKSEDQETVAEDETAEEDDYAVDYVNKDGLIAVNVQGKAAESRKFAVEALAEEEDVNRSLAKELADEIFRDFDGPYTPVTIDGFERSADGTNIEGISAKWVTSDTVDDGDPLHLYVKPEGDNRQSVMLQVDYHLSGQYDYGTGEVKIIIPAYIFTKRHTQEGEGPNYGNMIIPYPEDNNNTDDFKWSLEGDHYVLTNVNPLSAATKGFIRFTIAGMLPHDLIDMMESEPFSADIYVVTRATNKVLGLRSNSLTATFDTDAALTSVEKKQAGHVQIVTKDSIPVDQRIAGEEYYVLINWYMVVSTTSNTYYSLDYVDELIKNSAGKTYDGFIVQSYSNVTSDGTNGPDTVSTNAGTSNAFYGYRAMNGNTYMVQTAYPYSQFSPSTQYEFKNKVTFSLTEEDHPDNHETKSATATVKWSYEDPKWPSPGGHFMVNKNGNDGADKDNKTHNLAILNYTWNDIHLWNHLNNGYYGTYATALNDLREGNDVTLSYTIDSVGYVMPWLFDSTAPASEDGQPAAKSSRNYTRSVEIITEDTGMSIGRTIQDDSWDIPESATLDSIPLVAGTDYTLTSLEFPGSPYVYKAMPQRIGANGSVSATTYSDGTFKYVKDTNDANWPDVDIYIQTGGSSTWTKYATFSWKNDGFELESGGTVSGRKLELPENTTNFKTVVMLQNDPENEANDENYAIQAGINYDVRVETKLDHTSSTLMNKVNASFDESNAPQLYIFNSDRMTCNRADGNHDQIVVINRDGYNTVRGFELDTMVSPFKDGDFDESVDFVNGIATIHYSARIEEKTLISDEASYDQAVADGKIPVERNVIWRDLLPAGMTPDLNSIDLVREDDVLNYAYYVSIKELKPEYTGPDRYLMVVSATLSNEPEVYSGGEDGDVKYYYDVPQIKFDASIDLKSILGYGYDRSRIHNVISFESLDIKDLGTVENYQGEPDDPHANRNIATAEAFENEIEKTLMTDLDPDNDDNRFLYAGTYTRLVVPTAAISNLDKVVQVNNENRWSTGVYAGNKEANERLVYLDGTYRYRLSYSPDSADAVARNIILYDSLENFYAGSGNDGGIDEGAPRWQGTFAGVDTSMLEAQGCDPEVWYSTETNLLIASEENENQAHQVNTVLQGPVWVKASEYTGDLSLVKAIAVDASKSKEKDENGEPLDFEVEYGHSASVIINMKAPTVEEANENHYIYNESGEHIHGVFGDSAQAYNNAYVLCETYVGDPNASEHTFVRKDYTKVGLFNYDISVDKEWDDEDDRDGKRPESVIIQLWTEDGPVEGQEVELPLKDDNGEYILDDEGNYIWTYTFRYIPYTDEDGNVINYFFKEKEDPENPSEYSATSRIDGNKITLINKHKPERTEISGVKSWVGDSEEVRPTRIRVDLYADGEYLKCQYVSASTNWKWSFTNLYKYRDGGIPIEYTVVENEDYNDLDSYITTYGEDEIINTYHPYGDLKVHKKITDATDASKDAEFEFVFDFTHKVINDEGQTVTETLPGPFQYEILDEETGEFITGGEIMSGGSLKIKGGQIIHIIEIDEGAHYEITELETDGYYNNERTGYSGTIKPNTIVEANYENTYSTRGRADLKATKYFENHQIENYQFAYEVYLVTLNDEGEEVETLVRTATSSASGNTPYQTLEDGTVIYDAGVSLGAFSYSLKDNGKTFTYRIKERIPEDADSSLTAEGITYDDTVYTATVTVTDNGDGTMTCTVVYYDADGNEITDPAFRPSFYNVYKAEGQINLPAWKNLVGRKPVDGEFTFALLDENGEPVLDENGEAITTTNVGSEIIFPAIHYTEKDAGKSYRYKAVEIPGDDPNVHYTDKAIGYIVTVNDNNDGTLNPTYVFADPDTWETEGVGVGEFVNTLEPGGLKVTKKISEDSEDYDENQTFTFKIKFIGDVEGITFPEGFTGWDADTKTATVVLHGDETFEITNIPAGTDYQVTEQNLDGWIPISQENVSGTIITSEVAEATITNQYQPDMATVQLFGTKKLDNKAAEAGLFTFTLDEKSNTSGKIKIINERGKVVEVDLPLTVTNTDGGFIQFPIIVYDEPGEHTYTIKETVGNDDTINYDAHEETVKVTVTADANGMLLTTINYETGDVEFENKTYPGGLKITKEADTNQYTDDEFYFLVTLYNEDGQPLSEDGTIYWYTEKTDTSGL
ncbi:MAG: Cna B-type domain-containing protein, partial [Firmicutes bacterium]|nr:Cna B-type domain-containing protein [Bacillota bacterium]